MIAERRVPFRETVDEMDAWLDDVAEAMDGVSHPVALRALSGVLTAFRDTLPVPAALQLGGRLPAMLRTFYFQGYRPEHSAPAPGRRQFLRHVRYELRSGTECDAELAARAVLDVLERRLGGPELEAVGRLLPADVWNVRRGASVSA